MRKLTKVVKKLPIRAYAKLAQENNIRSALTEVSVGFCDQLSK
jgi:hypothetical protein